MVKHQGTPMRKARILLWLSIIATGAYCQDLCTDSPRPDNRCGPNFGKAGCAHGCCSETARCGVTAFHCNERSICPAKTANTSSSITNRTSTERNLPTAFNWCGARRMVVLSFDDGPTYDPPTTLKLLDDLKALHLKVSFFLCPAAFGRIMDQEQCTLMRRMIADGHSVHCHTMTHRSLLSLSNSEIYKELADWTDWFSDCGGRQQSSKILFRPPFGDLNKRLKGFINNLGFIVTTWNVDSKDWQGGTAQEVYDRTIPKFEARIPSEGSALILHHDAHYIANGTIGILEKYLQYFGSRGYSFVTADQCLAQCAQDNNCDLENIWPGVYERWLPDPYI